MIPAPPGEPAHGELTGAFGKLARAHTHLCDLESKVGKYVGPDGNACAVFVKLDGDEELFRDGLQTRVVNGEEISGHIFFRVQEPPPVISLILGDFLTNCRALLDHLAWQVREASAGDEREFGWPVSGVRIPEKPDKVNRRFKQLFPNAWQLMDDLYFDPRTNKRGESLTGHWLNPLVNSDKHRTLIDTDLTIASDAVRMSFTVDSETSTEDFGVDVILRDRVGNAEHFNPENPPPRLPFSHVVRIEESWAGIGGQCEFTAEVVLDMAGRPEVVSSATSIFEAVRAIAVEIDSKFPALLP